MSGLPTELAQLPSDLRELLQSFTIELPRLLGSNLVGAYLYGSLSFGAFNPASSDVDCVVVVGNNLGDGEFEVLGHWYSEAKQGNPWVERLEMTYIPQGSIMVSGSALCQFHQGEFCRMQSDGNPIIWLNILDCGITLYGADPATYVPKVTRSALVASLQLEVEYIREGIAKQCRENSNSTVDLAYQVYAVLTVCRICYTAQLVTVVSKQQAARWCIEKLPALWHEIIGLALAQVHNTAGTSSPRIGQQLADFVDYAGNQLDAW